MPTPLPIIEPTALSAGQIAAMQAEIRQRAADRNAVILAHNYQRPEVQDVAHYVGDSLGLSREAALRGALSQKVREGALTVVEGFGLSEYKTKRMAEILTGLGLAGKTALIVIEAADPHVEGSARNLPGVGVVRAEGLNVYDVLRHAHVVVTKAALEAIHTRLAGEGRA